MRAILEKWEAALAVDDPELAHKELLADRGVRRDPKILRRVSRILNKEGSHFANLFYIFE